MEHIVKLVFVGGAQLAELLVNGVTIGEWSVSPLINIFNSLFLPVMNGFHVFLGWVL
ncbi:hypothetical protein F5878DRAFT_618399, partial [Lentinula raphanica]